MYLKSFDDVMLHTVINEAQHPMGVIVINHGFSEHLGRYDHLASYLCEHGYHVIRYDLRGHGKTVSARGYISSYKEFVGDCDVIVNYAKNTYPSLPLIILGHSMGGFVSVNYALEHPEKVKGLILSGPALYDLPKSKGIYSLALNIMGRLLPKFTIPNPIGDEICSVKEVVESNREDNLVLKRVSAGMLYQFLKVGSKNIKAKQQEFGHPVLILHGEDDTIVPEVISDKFFKSIPATDKTRIVYPKLYHEIFNERCHEEIFETIVSWLNERESK